jgi:hypothetical protein
MIRPGGGMEREFIEQSLVKAGEQVVEEIEDYENE